MYCQTCGTTVSESSSSCGNCGAPVGGGAALSPYQPMIENHFTAAAATLLLFPLLGLLLPVGVDNTLVRISGWAMLGICPLIGVAGLFVSSQADSARNSGRAGDAVAKSKLAKLITRIGLTFGFVVAGFGVTVAFVLFLSGSGHAPEKDQPVAEAPTAPAEAPAEAATAKPDQKEK